MLLLACLIVFTGCVTSKTIVYVPSLPERPVLADPGRPVDNGSEADELEIILIMAQSIEELNLWIDNAIDAVDRLKATN